MSLPSSFSSSSCSRPLQSKRAQVGPAECSTPESPCSSPCRRRHSSSNSENTHPMATTVALPNSVQPPDAAVLHQSLNTSEASSLVVFPTRAGSTPWQNREAEFAEQAAQSVMPFLSEHIPEQYNPIGGQRASQADAAALNTKYCYRHRPDLKCKRQADEPSMAELQYELAQLSESDQQGISKVWSLFSAAPSKYRKLMLQGILAQCCFPQLSYLSSSVRELVKIDFLTVLPPELGLRVLCFLDPTSLCKAAQVSKRWRALADDDLVWHRMCEQHIDRKCNKCGWGLPLLDRQRLRFERRQMRMRLERTPEPQPPRSSFDMQNPMDSLTLSERPHPGSSATSTPDTTADSASLCRSSADLDPNQSATKKRSVAATLPSPGASIKKVCTPSHNYSVADSYFQDGGHLGELQRPWKDIYRDRFKIGTNWKYGRYSDKVLKGHTNGVMCLQFDDSILASGSYDSTIKIWDIETGEEIRTFTGHTLGVRCLQFDKSKLVSGSLDGTLKMWDLKTGKVLRTFPGHSGAVISLHFDATILASGSEDKTIRVRDFKNCSRVVLRGHTDWVNSVRVDSASNTLFSASDDCSVRVWDLDAKRCIRVFREHSAQVQQVLPLPAEFDLGQPGDDEEGDTAEQPDLSVVGSHGVNVSSASPIQVGSGSVARSATPRYMLTCSLDGTLRIWDVHSGRWIRTFFGHLEGVWSLAADTLRVVSGANDGMVKVWDPRTGKCERTFTGHRGPVTCVGLSDKRMCTGSEDHEIRLYNFSSSNSPENLQTRRVSSAANGNAGDTEHFSRTDGRFDLLHAPLNI